MKISRTGSNIAHRNESAHWEFSIFKCIGKGLNDGEGFLFIYIPSDNTMFTRRHSGKHRSDHRCRSRREDRIHFSCKM